MHSRLVALLTGCLAAASCSYFPESCFDLSPQSRLPKWFALPADTSRESASVHMCYYINQNGRTATFVFRGPHNGKLAEVAGTQKGLEPLTLKQPPAGFPPGYPSYEIITVGGVTDVIEHRRMEPIFYVNDDPSVWAELGVSR